MAGWNLNIVFLYVIPDAAVVLEVTPWSRDFMILMYATFFHFVLIFTEKLKKVHLGALVGAYAAAFFFVLANHIPGWFVVSLQSFAWGYYPIAGPVAKIFAVVFNIYIVYALVLLWTATRDASGYRRHQYRLVFIATLIFFGSALSNFLIALGVRAVYPFGNLGNMLYSLLVAYAIQEYGFLDIRVVLRRSATYGLLSGAMTVVYLSIVSIFKYLFGHHGLDATYAYYTAAVPIAIALVPALKARLEPIIDNVPFWKTHRYTEILKDFAYSVLTVLDLPLVSQCVIEKMCQPVHATSGAIYLHRQVSGSYTRVGCRGAPGPAVLESNHPLIEHLHSGEDEFLKEKAMWRYQTQRNSSKGHLAPEWLLDWPYALAFPLFVKHRFLGIIALGDKTSGDMYNVDDLQLLKMMAEQATVALSNALGMADLEARQKVLRDRHDSALMGVLATEIAHEMTKPLTRIINEKTRMSMKGASQQSLKKIEKEVQLATEIMEGFAMLSPEFPLPRVPASLETLLEETLNASGIDQDSAITIVRKYEKISPVSVNTNQMLQVFSNIVHNAWEAMSGGGTLTLTLAIENVSHDPAVLISVMDTGPGVPKELQDKVFEPFFTTKSANGGRGVGLTLSRAMVERHGGELILKSREKSESGTCVIVRLPLGPKGGSDET